MDNDPESCSNNNDLYFFVDPEKCGPAENDHMVFSESNRRLAYGEVRPVTRLDPSWRPSLIKNPGVGKTLKCKTSGTWVSVNFQACLLWIQPVRPSRCRQSVVCVDCSACELGPTAHETRHLASCSVPARKDGQSTFESLLRASRANEIVPVQTKEGQKTNWVTIKAAPRQPSRTSSG